MPARSYVGRSVVPPLAAKRVLIRWIGYLNLA